MMGTSGTDNFIAEQVLDGNVTLNLVMICFFVASVAIAITLWAVYRFQTKAEARELEARVNGNLDRETETLKEEIKSLHTDVTRNRDESRDDMGKVQSEVGAMRNDFIRVASDVSYIRGKLEPKS